jgi:hypothetical protein
MHTSNFDIASESFLIVFCHNRLNADVVTQTVICPMLRIDCCSYDTSTAMPLFSLHNQNYSLFINSSSPHQDGAEQEWDAFKFMSDWWF